VAPVFWSFRVMVGMGMLMLAVSWWAVWTLWRNRRANKDRVRRLLALAAAPAGGHDLLGLGGHAGRLVRHRDRPPALPGVRRAAHRRPGGAAPGGMVLATLALYLAVYAFLLVSYVLVLMYMAQHPAMPTPETPQSPKAATPIGGRPDHWRRA
jgi:cytochrome d ubiquinol oxidase subunit I